MDILTIVRQVPKALKRSSDTMAAMTIYKAAGGKVISDEMVEYVECSEEGKAMLEARPDIFSLLTDRERLRSLPEDTLGYQYISWADREGIYPEGLEGMGKELGLLGTESDEVLVYLERRQRVLHDLYHLLTGYDRDVAGEVALLRFSAIQEKNKALDFVSRIGQIRFVMRRRFDLFRLRRDASDRAHRAPILLVQNWEELIERPIDEVRKMLNLYPLPQYKQLV